MDMEMVRWDNFLNSRVLYKMTDLCYKTIDSCRVSSFFKLPVYSAG